MLKTPPLQTATATIDTLCGRLQSATLLEDRRAAILGLRSFAKQYPASVASGSLRELITTLRRDGVGNADGSSKKSRDAAQDGEEGGDVDTIRLVMETLVNLFNPDPDSAETSDEILFFMADEFSMRQDNVSLLLSLLDPTSAVADYYSRLYSVQLLSAICAARPERLQECILSAPLGVSRLVGVLDDARDAVRNAGLLLLVDLTAGASDELRKIVAFEDVFGKIFALIRLEGGLGDAGITAQDCLSLLANLIRGSASNQTMFRESGCVMQLKQLLAQISPADDDAPFVTQSREKGGWGLLQLLGLFLVPGESFTAQNQTAFFRAGTAQMLADIGFSADIPSPLRTAALQDAALLIQANAPLQEAFASMTVHVSIEDSTGTVVNGNRSRSTSTKDTPKSSERSSASPSAETQPTYIIEALLDLTLSNARQDQASRAAACALIQAYLTKHDRIKAHFLQRAIAGHAENEEAANALNTLLNPTSTDPLSMTFASWIIQDLIFDNSETKSMLATVKEGDEEAGEDLLTAIQTLGSHLQTSLQALTSTAASDERTITAHATLLMILLHEFPDGINNLLAEGSSLLQTLITSARTPSTPPAVAGAAAALLGVLYEFSTKDSPIPRRTLAPLLTQNLGRNNYLNALLGLRQHPAVRNFGLDSNSDPATDLQLSEPFVDLFLDAYPRLRKAIDKDPGLEVLAPGAGEEGIDRDVLDTLREELKMAKEDLATAQQDSLVLGQQHETEKLTSQKTLQTAQTEVERLRRINAAMQTSHEDETTNSASKYKQDLEQLQRTGEQRAQNSKAEAEKAVAAARREGENAVRLAKEDAQKEGQTRVVELQKQVAEAGNALRKAQTTTAEVTNALEALRVEHEALRARSKELEGQVESLGSKHAELETAHKALQTSAEADKSRVEILATEIEANEKDLFTVRERLEELQAELKAKETELISERTGFNDLEKEFEALKVSSASDKEASAKDLQMAKADGEKAVKEAKAKSEKELAAAKDAQTRVEKGAEKEKAKDAKAKDDKGGKDAKAVEMFKTRVQELTAELKSVREEVAAAKTQLEEAREQAEVAKNQAEAAKEDVDAAKKSAGAEKAAVEKAREGEKEAKEELESMLLVMGDIEAKRDEYRERVKKAGGDVTEDEESGSDEEEDDDDDDNEEEGNRTDATID